MRTRIGPRRKHLLRFGSGRNCGRRGGERDKERVALRIHFDAVVANERLTQSAAMLRQRIRVGLGTQLLQEPRRALDVGEDESDGSGRKLACHAAIQARRTTRCRTPPGAVDWTTPSVRRVRSTWCCALPHSAHRGGTVEPCFAASEWRRSWSAVGAGVGNGGSRFSSPGRYPRVLVDLSPRRASMDAAGWLLLLQRARQRRVNGSSPLENFPQSLSQTQESGV